MPRGLLGYTFVSWNTIILCPYMHIQYCTTDTLSLEFSKRSTNLRGATQSPGKYPIFSSLKIGGGRGVNPGFGKIDTKDSKYGRDVLFGGLNFFIEVQKMK